MEEPRESLGTTTPENFRFRLQLAFMLAVLAVTVLALYVAQRNLQADYEQRLGEEFQSRMSFHLGEREARQAAVAEQCRSLARSVRIRAALEEADVEDLYLNARIELRDILEASAGQRSGGLGLPRLEFFRFLDANGKVLSPPGEAPQTWEQQLKFGADKQQIGFIIIGNRSAGDRLVEVFATPIVAPDGTVPGFLVLGFQPLDFTSKSGGPDMKHGILYAGHLFLGGVSGKEDPDAINISKEVAEAIATRGENLVLQIKGEPHRLFYQSLDSLTGPAYRISLCSLKDSLAEQKRLRWRIVGIALLVLLGGLGASHFISARITKPVEALFEDSALNLARSEKAEAQLVLTEQKYRSIFENAVEGIYLLGPDGAYLSANPSLARIYGYQTAQELLQQLGNPAHALYVNPEDSRRLLALAKADGVVSNFEAEVFCKDGKRIWISQNLRSVRDPAGEVMHFEGTLEDISARKHSADALRSINQELEKALAELKATQAQIIQQERLRALGQMASGIAHDFNNALTPIIGFSELLLGIPHVLADPARTAESLNVIRTAARDASKIVARLREFYRANETEDVFAPVDLKHLAEQSIALTQPKWKDQAQANGADIRIVLELVPVPLIAGDESALRELLTNLIFNAVDAMPTGGAITLRTRSDAKSVFIEVADTGTGMTEEVRERCLEPFFSTKGDRGTGLGLSMVFGIVKRHEGTIDIESQLGVGTKFVLAFPLKGDALRATSPVQSAQPFETPLAILMVDDEEHIRMALSALLEADGHLVDTARDGVEGFSKFRAGRYDLVITDRAMPGMSGEQLGVAIKEISPSTPVVVLSGFASAVERGKIPGVDVMAGKPIQLASLREAVHMAMECCTVV